MTYLNKDDKIFVAGHRGLVGSALVVKLKERGFLNIITRTHQELDLANETAVNDFYSKEKPDMVFVAAAKVGGIHANNVYRADFIYENLKIQNNVIWGAHKANVRRLVFLGSSCIYPKFAPQPMQETSLLTGELEYTNRPYAIAKIAGLELVNALHLQYGRDYFSVMPTNLYGPHDNFHPTNSHLLPALIRRFEEAHRENRQEVAVWGTGKPKRELMFSLDCADAIVHLAEKMNLLELKNTPQGKHGYLHINIGTGVDMSVEEIAYCTAEVIGFKGKIKFDITKPDGTPRKLLDVSCLKSLGWQPKVSFQAGLRQSVEWFRKNYADIK